MRVLVTGASGLIGTALMRELPAAGHEGIALKRGTEHWDPDRGVLRLEALEGLDAVVHLAGENIASGRWTSARKSRLRESRVRSTRLLAKALGRMPRPPKILVCASAVGFYGDRRDEVLNERSPAGAGFLAGLCKDWEAAADPARASVRVVHLRFGMVLSPEGGALARMLLPFRLGLGGPIGSGRQFWSWISLPDAVGAVLHVLGSDLSGPVNAVSPRPGTCREFSRDLGRTLSRPAFLPLPAFAARAVFGEMADGLLLASARAVPDRLRESGFVFRDPDLPGALEALLHP